MPVLPSSPDAHYANEAKNLLANCATFIAATGSVDYLAAKEYIAILEALPNVLDKYPRPFGLVLLPQTEFRVSKPGIPTSGQVKVILEINIPKNLSPDEELFTAANFFGNIKSEMSQLGCMWKAVVNDARLRFLSVTQAGPYIRSRDTEEQEVRFSGFWHCELLLNLA